jgi:hypothetical protein
MKKILFISSVAALLFSACTPDNNFEAGTPQNRLAQINGNWKLQAVTQTDLIAKNNNFNDPDRPEVSLQVQDITSIVPYTDISVSFTEDAANAPTTFTANYGAGPKIFKNTAGSWKVDNLAAPGQISFINGLDTVRAALGAVNTLSSGILNLQVIKYQGIKPVIQYNYNFKKN